MNSPLEDISEQPIALSNDASAPVSKQSRSILKTSFLLVSAMAAGFLLHAVVFPAAQEAPVTHSNAFPTGSDTISRTRQPKSPKISTQASETAPDHQRWEYSPTQFIDLDARDYPTGRFQYDENSFAEILAGESAHIHVESNKQYARLQTEDDVRLKMYRYYYDLGWGFGWGLKLHHGYKLRFVYYDQDGVAHDKCYIDGRGNNNRLNFTGAHTCHPEGNTVEGLEVGQCLYMTGAIKNLEELGDWEALPVVRGDGPAKKFYGIYLEYIEGDQVTFYQGNFANDVPKTDERIWVGAHGNMAALAYPDTYHPGDYLVPDGKYLRKSAEPGIPAVRCLQEIELTEVGKIAIEM